MNSYSRGRDKLAQYAIGRADELGDYVVTVEVLLEAGARAPEVTDDLEASEPVKELLRERPGVA